MTSIGAVEDRLRLLEQRFGVKLNEGHVEKVTFTDGKSCIIENLKSIDKKLCEVASERDRVKEIYAKIGQLREFLKENTGEGGTSEKLKIVELCENVNAERVAQLEILSAFLPLLDSEHIHNAATLENRLKPIAISQLDTRERIKNHTTELSGLIVNYNDVVRAVNRLFIHWDKILTHAEKSTIT